MRTGRRHRFLLLMLCAFIVSLLMNAGMAAGVRASTSAWPGNAAKSSLVTSMCDANTADTHGESRPTPAGDTCGVDVTVVDDDCVLPAFQLTSFNYLPPPAPSSPGVADLSVPAALFLRPPNFA